MKTRKLIGLLTFFSFFLLTTSSSSAAVTMTLENLLPDQDDPYSEFGFTIVAPGAHLHNTFNTVNFTDAAQLAADTSGMSLTKDDGGQFDLISIDAFNILGLDVTTGSFAIQIDGLVGGAVQVSKQLLSDGEGLINFLSENTLWSGLDEVQFWYESQPTGFGSFSTFSGDDFKFDNIIVEASAVPVPAAVWLFGSALTGLGVVMRKKKVVA